MTEKSFILAIALSLVMLSAVESRRHKSQNKRSHRRDDVADAIAPAKVDEKLGQAITAECELKKGSPAADLNALNNGKTEFTYFNPEEHKNDVELCKASSACEKNGKKPLIFTMKNSDIKAAQEISNQKIFLVEAIAQAFPQENEAPAEIPAAQPLAETLPIEGADASVSLQLAAGQKKTSLKSKSKKKPSFRRRKFTRHMRQGDEALVAGAIDAQVQEKIQEQAAAHNTAQAEAQAEEDDSTFQVYDCCKVGLAHASEEPEKIEDGIKKEHDQKQVATANAGGEGNAGGDAAKAFLIEAPPTPGADTNADSSDKKLRKRRNVKKHAKAYRKHKK